MSVFYKVYEFGQVGNSWEWILKGTTYFTSFLTGYDSTDKGKIFFWRVDSCDDVTGLETKGDVWVFWLKPLPIFGSGITLTGYYLPVASTVDGYSSATPWIPEDYILTLPGEASDYPELSLPNAQIEFSDLIDYSTMTFDFSNEWKFVDGEWKWVSEQNIYGGGRYQNKMVVISHNCIYCEEY